MDDLKLYDEKMEAFRDKLEKELSEYKEKKGDEIMEENNELAKVEETNEMVEVEEQPVKVITDTSKVIEIKPQYGHIAFQVIAAILTGGISIIISWETERAMIKQCENIMEQMGGCDCDKK